MVKIDSNAISDFFSGIGNNIYNSALEAINEYSMAERIEQGVLVGLSGGADSVMLLCFLLEYRRRRGLDFNKIGRASCRERV